MRSPLLHIVLAFLLTLLYAGERFAPCMNDCSTEDVTAALRSGADASDDHGHEGAADCDDHHTPEGDHHCDHCVCPCHVPVVATDSAAIASTHTSTIFSDRLFYLPPSAPVEPLDPVPLA